MNYVVNHKRKNLIIPVKEVSGLGRIIGLMFRGKDENLLFRFNHEVSASIHSLFVFFPFLAVWLDEADKVINFKVIRPFKIGISPKKNFRKLIELPFNSSNEKIINYFLGKKAFNKISS